MAPSEKQPPVQSLAKASLNGILGENTASSPMSLPPTPVPPLPLTLVPFSVLYATPLVGCYFDSVRTRPTALLTSDTARPS